MYKRSILLGWGNSTHAMYKATPSWDLESKILNEINISCYTEYKASGPSLIYNNITKLVFIHFLFKYFWKRKKYPYCEMTNPNCKKYIAIIFCCLTWNWMICNLELAGILWNIRWDRKRVYFFEPMKNRACIRSGFSGDILKTRKNKVEPSTER